MNKQIILSLYIMHHNFAINWFLFASFKQLEPISHMKMLKILIASILY